MQPTQLCLTEQALANCKQKRGTHFSRLFLAHAFPSSLSPCFPLRSFLSPSLALLFFFFFFAFLPLAPSPRSPSSSFSFFLIAFVLHLLSFRCFCSPFPYIFSLLSFHDIPSFPYVSLWRFTQSLVREPVRRGVSCSRNQFAGVSQNVSIAHSSRRLNV